VSSYSFAIQSFSGLSFSPTWFSGYGPYDVTGSQWQVYATSGFSPTFTTPTTAATAVVSVTDTEHGTAGTTLDDYSRSSHGQTLSSSLTLNGVTYPAGSTVEDEYEVTLVDSSGTTYRLVAISINSTVVGYTWEGAAPDPGTTLTYVSGSAADNQSMVPCFAAGTRIATPEGPRPVERLRPGDRVFTLDGPVATLRWCGARKVDAGWLARSPALRPIRIAAGALGAGEPERDLLVSPQHRMLVRSAIAERIGGAREVLVAAKHLVGLPGIDVATEVTEVTYVHLLCDRHEVLFANGALSESLYPGPQALQSLPRAARAEILALFPGLGEGRPLPPARPLLTGRQGRSLARRHQAHQRVLVGT